VRGLRRSKAGVVQEPDEATSSQPLIKHIIYFELRDTQVPLPLGWMLSADAAKTLREQINQNDDVVQNQSALNEVLKTLPPTR